MQLLHTSIGRARAVTEDIAEVTKSAIDSGVQHAVTLVKGEPEDPAVVEARKNRVAIIQGLIGGRVAWADDCCKDLLFYLKQNHVLLAIFTSHRMHPYSKNERLLVYAASLLASFGVTMALLNRETGKAEQGLNYMAASIGSSIIITVLTTVATQAFTCSCCQEGSCCHCGQASKSGAEGLGWCVACICLGCASLMFAGGVLIGWNRHIWLKDALIAFGWSQVSSFVMGFILGPLFFSMSFFGIPCCGGSCCVGQRGRDRDATGAAFPHGAEYPTDWEMFVEGDHCSYYRDVERPVPSPNRGQE